jgi:hypothetical protein
MSISFISNRIIADFTCLQMQPVCPGCFEHFTYLGSYSILSLGFLAKDNSNFAREERPPADHSSGEKLKELGLEA